MTWIDSKIAPPPLNTQLIVYLPKNVSMFDEDYGIQFAYMYKTIFEDLNIVIDNTYTGEVEFYKLEEISHWMLKPKAPSLEK